MNPIENLQLKMLQSNCRNIIYYKPHLLLLQLLQENYLSRRGQIKQKEQSQNITSKKYLNIYVQKCFSFQNYSVPKEQDNNIQRY